MPNDVFTLTRDEYLGEAVWQAEREQIFHGGWVLAGAGQRLAPGNRTVVDIAGESVLLTRDLQGGLHTFANVCRHRGSRLCEGTDLTTQGSLMCPYHAWTYALDGRLIATPHLDETEVDKSTLPLWQYHLREWHGLVFVSLHADPPPFDEWLQRHAAEMLRLERFGIGDLKVVASTVCDIAANWKIIVENYQECLHCTRVHPELVDLVPLYRTGWVADHTRDDGGVALERGTTMSPEPVDLPPLPGANEIDRTSYYGGDLLPQRLHRHHRTERRHLDAVPRRAAPHGDDDGLPVPPRRHRHARVRPAADHRLQRARRQSGQRGLRGRAPWCRVEVVRARRADTEGRVRHLVHRALPAHDGHTLTTR